MSVLDGTDAVVVIDMQNSFLRPDGAMYHHRGQVLLDAERTIDRNAELIALAMARGLPVVYTRHCYRRGYADAGERMRGFLVAMPGEPLLAGSWDASIVDELRPAPGALVVDKTRMDAFYNSDLEVLLRGLGAARITVAGIVTNACVETTTRSAAMRDLDTSILQDCCTTYSTAHQAGALDALAFYLFATIGSLASA